MSIQFTAEAPAPDCAYEQFIANWQPPATPIHALPGWAIIEFAPFGNRGTIFQPEEASNNAMVVHDGYDPVAGRAHFGHCEGFLKAGTEVIYTGTQGTKIEWEGRKFMRVPKREIELYVPKKEAA